MEQARKLLDIYFQTQVYPFTRHHIDSFDQFLSSDLSNIIKSQNPILILKKLIPEINQYAYKVEIFIGGQDGSQLEIGNPTVSLQNTEEVRLLYPNEARLRNLTYSAVVQANILAKISITQKNEQGQYETTTTDIPIEKYSLFRIPILLHSRYCILHGKPKEFLTEAGECSYDSGGYFIIGGTEKVLITHQEQAFNTLYVSLKERDPQVNTYATISCLSPKNRLIKRIAFAFLRNVETIQVTVPFIRKPVPVFVLFRALGIQSDEEIINMIFPDKDLAETKILLPMLMPSIADAYPFIDTHMAVQYMKTLTKGFGTEHVLDILHNQTFIHVDDSLPLARIEFLADCVRKILRVAAKLDIPTSRDDIRNQRCLVSGFLVQTLFQGVYKSWTKSVGREISEEYSYHNNIYEGSAFANIFSPGNINKMFQPSFITEGLMRAFRGKWGSGLGEEKAGVLQPLSRLSYLDFVSHTRRVVLEFDTGLKLVGPRRLNTSQFGYFCTNETPGGGSIGITKNLSILTYISTASPIDDIRDWLFTRGELIQCADLTASMKRRAVPFYVNGGILGYTMGPKKLVQVLKLFKWTGCISYSAGIGFSIRERRVFLYLDEGRPLRPLIHKTGNLMPSGDLILGFGSWRKMVLGSLPQTEGRGIQSSSFFDPLASKAKPTLDDYVAALEPFAGCIEYVDPYEHNESFIAMFPNNLKEDSTHLEVHPSSMFGIMTGLIPFANHNQSPRNQLSCSQSKQGVSIFATNWQNRFDNQVHLLCYGEQPLVKTHYSNYIGNGDIPYGANIILALACYSGYNRDDGIIMNKDSLERGLFRSIFYRSYEAFEEDDQLSRTKTRIAHPKKIASWTSLKAGLDYSKLDESGIISVGEIVNENTVIVSRYLQTQDGVFKDASVTPQVWTSGRVEKIAITVNNQGNRLIKIRITQDRQPELGDKFSNRHGQKGTIGIMMKASDMPQTASGIVPDMIYNPHSIPSRMTIAQLLEQLFGKAVALSSAVGDATTFMTEENPHYNIATILKEQYGFEPYGNEVMYNGQTGEMIPTSIFIAPLYQMRLKHMVEDKWNARAEGRREQRTHQPTGGRGNQGGLRIGEMERDAIIAHGGAEFIDETYMKRADGSEVIVCNSCGTVPIYNEKDNLFFCSLCDGPAVFVGDSVENLSLIPSPHKSDVTFSKVRIPYSMKLLDQELNTFLNIGMRIGTAKYLKALPRPTGAEVGEATGQDVILPQLVLPDIRMPERQAPPAEPVVAIENILAMGAQVLGAAADAIKDENEFVATNQPLNLLQPQPLTIRTTSGVLQGPAPGEMLSQNAAPIAQVPAQEQQQQQAPATVISISVPQGQQGQQLPPDELSNAQPLPTMTLQTPVPGAPPTYFVDTGPQAMGSMGLSGAPVTRSIRNMIPGSGQGQMQMQRKSSLKRTEGLPSNTRFNIIKEG